MHSANLKRYWPSVIEQVSHFQVMSLGPRRFKASTSTSAQLPHHEMHPRVAGTNELVLEAQHSPQREQLERLEVETGVEDEAPLTADELELFSMYIPPCGRHPTEEELELIKLNERALEAFERGDRKSFVEIVTSTNALFTQDDAVRLAAEMNWIEEMEQLLVRETSDVYENYVRTAPLSRAFARLTNNFGMIGYDGRWLLKTAVLRAVKANNETIFNLLAPIVGVDFVDGVGWDAFEIVDMSRMDPDTKKRWTNSPVGYVDESTSPDRLRNAIYRCAEHQLTAHLPRLLDLLFSKVKSSSIVGAALWGAIEERHHEVARCLIDKFEEASIPLYRSHMRLATRVGDVKMIEYLCQHGCNSFTLESYGANDAKCLRKLLRKNKLDHLYNKIIVD